MPWVRIDENAMDHPKIAGLPAETFRLWVQALAYCQKFLTDGYVTDVAVRGLRSFSQKRRDTLIAAGLWDIDGAGIRVHDFLDWNESREQVMASRRYARERMKKLRRNKPGSAPEVRETFARTSSGVGVRTHTANCQNAEGGPGETEPPSRAGAFCEWYSDTHHRLFGVGYMGSQKDYQSALQLVSKFSDRELRDAAIVWFGMDDDFATSGTRTIPKFASRITGCLQLIHEQGIA